LRQNRAWSQQQSGKADSDQHVSVEPYSLPDPKLPFSQLFSVQNTSQLFTIHELMPRCQIESMRDTRGNTFKFGDITATREDSADARRSPSKGFQH
jgi:hypothetical protein